MINKDTLNYDPNHPYKGLRKGIERKAFINRVIAEQGIDLEKRLLGDMSYGDVIITFNMLEPGKVTVHSRSNAYSTACRNFLRKHPDCGQLLNHHKSGTTHHSYNAFELYDVIPYCRYRPTITALMKEAAEMAGADLKVDDLDKRIMKLRKEVLAAKRNKETTNGEIVERNDDRSNIDGLRVREAIPVVQPEKDEDIW